MSTLWAQNNPSALPEYFEATAATILATQLPSGAIPWFETGKIDPWDHVEAAMGLASMNHIEAAVSAYDGLLINKHPRVAGMLLMTIVA